MDEDDGCCCERHISISADVSSPPAQTLLPACVVPRWAETPVPVMRTAYGAFHDGEQPGQHIEQLQHQMQVVMIHSDLADSLRWAVA